MQNIFSSIADNLDVFIPILLVLITLVVVYLVFMVRVVIDMLRYDVHGVLLTFAFIALIPIPPILVRHPRQSRWLNECDRLKGGCPCRG
ncbi:MAG: hypothetical protein QNJ46_17445, partial [Leptolyngbyaceae cyanobacterium MO_188.B28]|nr:hypothetical protein [Leptolyngbyaceae cyanobacterium MO_188.B28]